MQGARFCTTCGASMTPPTTRNQADATVDSQRVLQKTNSLHETTTKLQDFEKSQVSPDAFNSLSLLFHDHKKH